MSKAGILIVQHGDFPFDFIEKERPMYERIEGVMKRLSEESKKLDHSPENDPHGADMRTLTDGIRGAGYDVELGFLDFARPTIDEAVAALAGRGHRKIAVACAPGLMMRSSHSLIDVPAALKEIGQAHPGLELAYAKPGIPFPLIVRALGNKINAALGAASTGPGPALPPAAHPGAAVVLVAHGDVPRDFIARDPAVMRAAEEHAAQWSRTVMDWPRTGENDPNYYDTLVLMAALREMVWPAPAEVGYLEFARPTVDEAADRLVAAGADRIVVAGGTGFFDRSSHTLIDIPQAIARLEERLPGIGVTYACPDIGLVKADLLRAVAYKIERALEGDTMPF